MNVRFAKTISHAFECQTDIDENRVWNDGSRNPSSRLQVDIALHKLNPTGYLDILVGQIDLQARLAVLFLEQKRDVAPLTMNQSMVLGSGSSRCCISNLHLK